MRNFRGPHNIVTSISKKANGVLNYVYISK